VYLCYLYDGECSWIESKPSIDPCLCPPRSDRGVACHLLLLLRVTAPSKAGHPMLLPSILRCCYWRWTFFLLLLSNQRGGATAFVLDPPPTARSIYHQYPIRPSLPLGVLPDEQLPALFRSSARQKSSRTRRIRSSSAAASGTDPDATAISPCVDDDDGDDDAEDRNAPFDGASDAEYYRRRSDLLQKILDKTREEALSARDKVVVLQDVVQKQSRRLEKQQLQWQNKLQALNETDARSKAEEAAAAAEASATDAAEQVRAAQLQNTIEELQTTLTKAEERAARLQSALDKAEHSLAKRKGEMQHQQLYYQSQIEELRRSDDVAELEAEKARQMLGAQRLLLDQSKQQREQELQAQLLQAEERFNTSLAVARSKFEAKIKETRAKLQESERAASELRELDIRHQRQVAEWEERLLIASASVRASEQREDELVATVDQLRTVAASRNDTIRHLQAKVEELRSHVDSLEGSRNDVTAIAPSTSREDAATIEDLEEQIRNLKHAHAAQLRSQRKQFEREMNELREQMETERESVVISGTAAAVRSTTVSQSSRPPAPGAAKRLWQRVKRPFQKR
jgi:hypothetical protein